MSADSQLEEPKWRDFVKKGDIEKLEKHFKGTSDAEDIDFPYGGVTAFQIAENNNDIPMMKFLIKNGADGIIPKSEETPQKKVSKPVAKPNKAVKSTKKVAKPKKKAVKSKKNGKTKKKK